MKEELEKIEMLTYMHNTGNVEMIRRTFEYYKKYEEPIEHFLENNNI